MGGAYPQKSMECLLVDKTEIGIPHILLGQPRGNILISAEEIEDSKFEVNLQLSASKLDKKDFFGKVNMYMCT